MQALPGSGKSTWAEAQKGAFLISADKLRTDPVTGKYNNRGHKVMEKCIEETERLMVVKTDWIIIDNTNIYQKQAQPYIDLAMKYGYKVDVKRIVADPQEAFARQTHGVPLFIIRKWAKDMENIEIYPPLKAIIVDIDGTIADVSKRLEYALSQHPRKGPKFWNAFLDGNLYHLDRPIEEARKILEWYPGKVFYLSGRRSGTEIQTRIWITGNGFPDGQIFHRPKRENTLNFKVRVIRELMAQGYIIESGWGDTDQDREAYEQAGIPALIVPWGQRRACREDVE